MRYIVYKFDYKPNDCISFAMNYMCLQAFKLWNQANYERIEYEKIGSQFHRKKCDILVILDVFFAKNAI